MTRSLHRNPNLGVWLISDFLAILSILMLACGGNVETPGDDDDDDAGGDDDATEQVSDEVIVTFFDATSGETVEMINGYPVSQTVVLQIDGGAATTMSFLSPPELVGIDLDSAPGRLSAQWDTTREMNGEVQISVEADGPGGPVTETISVIRNNISANLKGAFADERDNLQFDNLSDGDYARSGTDLLLSFQASAFGSVPTLNRIEIRDASGGGLFPALPLAGTPDGDWFDFNLGRPTQGTIDLMVSAVNNDGDYSEPLVLSLEVLRDDLISPDLPYDFEVTADGRTGMLLVPTGESTMRLDFLDLSDPSNPQPHPERVSLSSGVSVGGAAVGNLIVSPTEDKAFVLFANSVQVYSFDTAARALLDSNNVFNPISPNSGAGVAHINRAPMLQITSDGSYLFALSSTANLVMLDTATMTQVGPEGSEQKGFTAYPLGGGLFTLNPNGKYIYMINSWGEETTGAGQLAVFSVDARQYVALTDRGSQVMFVENSPESSYVLGQQPLVTPDGNTLATVWCDPSTGGTKVTFLSLADPQRPSISSSVNLYDQRGQTYGTAVRISPSGLFLLIADRDPNAASGLVVDLTYNRPVSGLEFPNGVMDGVFSPDSSTIFTLSSSWMIREMTTSPLLAPDVVDLDIPSTTGLTTPSDADDLRANLIVRSGNYIYFVVPARVLSAGGYYDDLGTAMSVFDINAGKFIYPNPL